MEAELTCPVCLELYTEPLMLPCSHSICRKCLADIVESNTKDGVKMDGVECPSCRHVVPLINGSLDSLPRNLVVENVILCFTEEDLSRMRDLSAGDTSSQTAHEDGGLVGVCDIGGAGDGRACELCDRPSTSGAARAAAWYCRRCRLAYCRPCLRLFHPRRGSLASHRILPASEAPAAARGDEQRCRAHPLEVATVYCEACAVCACHVCVCDGGAHVGHAIVTLKAACAKMKTAAVKVMEEGGSLLEMIERQRENVQAHALKVTALHTHLSSQLDAQFDRLLADLTTDLTVTRDLARSTMAAALNDLCQTAERHGTALARCCSAARQVATAGTRLSSGGDGDVVTWDDARRTSDDTDATDVLAGCTRICQLKSQLKDCVAEVAVLTETGRELLEDTAVERRLHASLNTFSSSVYEQMLQRNLIYLAAVADSNQNQQPQQPGQMMPGGQMGGGQIPMMGERPSSRPMMGGRPSSRPMMGGRPASQGPTPSPIGGAPATSTPGGAINVTWPDIAEYQFDWRMFD